MRDLDKNPYSEAEQRVAQFFFDRGTGGGDDPIGAILASHQALADQRNELQRWRHDQEVNWPMEIERRNRELAAMTKERDEWRQAAGVEAGLRREFKALSEKLQGCLDNYQKTFDLQWAADQRAIKRWQAAHPEKSNVWPDRADMVVWLMEQTFFGRKP